VIQLQELLEGFGLPARVELTSFEPADEPDQSEVQFVSFDASRPEGDVPLSITDQLDHFHSLQTDAMTVTDGVIYWNGR